MSPNLKVGGVFAYAQPSVNLAVQSAHYNIDAFQFGGYASYTAANWFADGLAAYGRQNFGMDRQGIIDVIHGSTHADTWTLAGKTGYLFDAGLVRVGPIAGLSYINAQIAGFTETGDILLTNIVNKQSLENLTGSAGVQLRSPLVIGAGLYSPFVNVTAEHDFIGSGRTLTTTQVTTPLLPVLTPVDSRNQTYGKVAAGVAAMLTNNVSAMVNGVTTFARADGNDYGVNGGVKVSF
jgi:outer membrane autotransporter protein